MAQSYKQKQVVRYYMCDRTNKLTLSMLVNVLLEISGQQSALLNRGEDFVRAMGLSWIIIHYDFEINRMPKAEETVEIETIATEYNKLFTYRDFYVRDKNNEVIITVKTTFALMDLEKRRMARLPEIVIAPYQAEFSKRIRRNVKAMPVEKESASQKIFNVSYFDIDSNNHVNNSRYINWALESLDEAFLSSHTIKKGVISFEKEVKENEIVTSYSNTYDDEELITAHHLSANGMTNCTATFVWDRNKKEG